MPRERSVSSTVLVAAAPSAVYALVSDPTRTAEWSPENTGARSAAGGSLPVGAVFTGSNRRHGARWTTECVVTTADTDERFGFRVRAIGVRAPRVRARIASWEHRLEGVDGGTRVTQTWTDDRRWPDPVAAVVDRVLTRTTFAAFQRRNIDTSLNRLRALLEAVG